MRNQQAAREEREPDMEQRTGSKLVKEYVKTACRCLAYLIYMHNRSCKMLGWMNHKLESRLPREKPQVCRWHHPNSRKRKGTKNPLDKGGWEEWKSWLKTQHSKYEDHGIQSHHFIANKWKLSNDKWQNRSSDRLYFLRLQYHCRW